MRFKQFKIVEVDIDVTIGIPQLNKLLKDMELNGENILDVVRKGNVYDITYQTNDERGDLLDGQTHDTGLNE